MQGPFRGREVRWWVRDGSDAAAAIETAEQAIGSAERGELVNQKDGRRKGLYHVPEADGPGYLLKVNRYAGTARWRRRSAGSKARQELRAAEAATARGIATPLPLIVGERTRAGLLVGCFNLVPRLAGAIDLRAALRDGGWSARERRTLATPLGAFAAAIHDAGIDQDDFSPNNFLVREGNPHELWMIDFERVRIGRAVSRRRRAEHLAKFSRELTRASNAERLRFLRGYAPGEEEGWWERVADATHARSRADLARLSRTCLGDGRRFARFRGDGFRGHCRDGATGPPRPGDLGDPAPPPEIVGDRLLVPLGHRTEPRDWVVANLLFLRELAPRPLAYWRGDAGGSCIAYAADGTFRLAQSPFTSSEQPAVDVLARRIAAITESPPAVEGPIAVARGPRGESRALWVDPRTVRPG